MKENFDPQTLEEPHRELEYADEFKEFIADNPGVLKRFLVLEKQIDEREYDGELDHNDVVEDGGLKISFVTKVKKEASRPADYMKVEIGDHAFFVKRVIGQKHYPKITRPLDEKESLEKASEVLQKLDNVKVVDFQLAYQDKKNRLYYVSKFLDFPRLNDYIWKKRSENMENIAPTAELFRRAGEITDLLYKESFYDVHAENMLYDEETDTIYVFDVFEYK